MVWLLIYALVGSPVDSTFPSWKDTQPVPVKQIPSAQFGHVRDPNWVVIREHPALDRDSTLSVEITHPLMEAVLWPFDHLVRPGLRLALRPLHSEIDYGEQSRLIDRGIQLAHPDSVATRWLYPVATLDGTAGSSWGLVYLDQNLLDRDWSLRTSARYSIQQDGALFLGISTPSYPPLGLSYAADIGLRRSGAVGLRVPGISNAGDPSILGATSVREVVWNSSVTFPTSYPGSAAQLSLQSAWRDSRKASRQDLELPRLDTIPWFASGDRGTEGTETDRTVQLWTGWSDQDLSGAPTKGGTIGTRLWQTWATGGGDVFGMELQTTRYLLFGEERYVYRAEDLRPYLDLDPREVIKLLDPSTLRQRLTQRKILALHFRMARIWETDPLGTPASYFLFPTLGGSAPARAYPSAYFLDKTVAGLSLEYRWPIWKYVDGVAFTELAWASPDWWIPSLGQLGPGAGTGFRVRLERQFLFRCHLAYGRAGVKYAATSSAEF